MRSLIFFLLLGITLIFSNAEASNGWKHQHGRSYGRCSLYLAENALPTFDTRSSGILLPMSALPGEHGIGDFGSEAYKFVDWLAGANQKWWQILPLNPADISNSPFSSESSFAFDLAYLSLEKLVQDGLITEEKLLEWKQPESDKTDWSQARKIRRKALNIVLEHFTKYPFKELRKEFDAFKSANSFWLADHTVFTLLKSLHGHDFSKWDKKYRAKKPVFLVKELEKQYPKEVISIQFEQFILERQWKKLKQYANEKGIAIIGDMPIYVARYSADVFANPEAFQLDGNLVPLKVSGLPPCDFYPQGQLWGHPVYNWLKLKPFWEKRIRRAMQTYDATKIDHFKGFESFYSVDVNATDAKSGTWNEVKGSELLDHLKKMYPGVKLIAEDLGNITKKVLDIRDRFSIPGMRVMQFGYAKNGDPYHQIEQFSARSIAYTGTHDNATMEEWLSENLQNGSRHDAKYWIEKLIKSPSNVALVQAQDLLGLGAEARFNYPGTWPGASDPALRRENWVWKLTSDQLDETIQTWLKEITEKSNRIKIEKPEKQKHF